MSTYHYDEQSCILQEDTHDDEDRANATSPPRDSGKTTTNSEKIGSDVGVTMQSYRTTCERDEDVEHDDDKEYEDSFPGVDLDDQPDAKQRGSRRVFTRISSSTFPPQSDEEGVEAHTPHYRILPILSGVTIPFCILLDIPGLLIADRYIRTNGSTVAASKPNPALLDVVIGLSLLCAVLANVCLVIRFLERRIGAMTILCIIFLSIHDIINILALATFGAMKDNYTDGQAFWITLPPTIASMFTKVTLIIDFIRTPDFTRSGSGLTRKQRSLVIIVIGLFCYIALGALVNSLLLDLTFINGLYFTVVTIETIGFGDIVPTSASSRVFICLYATLGVINIAFMVEYVRETVLEGLDFGYRRRLLAIQERRRAARCRRRAEKRWRHAVIWRLHGAHAPVWIPKKTNEHKSIWSILTSCFRRAEWGIRSTARRSTHQSHGQYDMQLNLWALPPFQLEAAALEAGVPLDTLLPADFYDTHDQRPGHHTLPSWFVVHSVYPRDEHLIKLPTYRWMGTMAGMLTKLSLGIYESGGDPFTNGYGVQNASVAGLPEAASNSSGSLETKDEKDYRADVEDTEKDAYYTRFSLSLLWLLIFWMGGAAIFKATEGWTYGWAIYFCFISFSTIGFGEVAPSTPAGRSIFVVWALMGVATMTIFISVVSEAYNSRYKGILDRNSFNQVVRQYHKRKKAELSEKLRYTGTSAGVTFVPRDTFERDVVQDESPQADPTAEDDTISAVTLPSRPDQQVQHARRSLERLPQRVLEETRLIERYTHLIGEFDERSIEAKKFVGEMVWGLIDDVIGRRQLTEESKKDILKDGESRQTLMLLGIGRCLKELVDISEQAIAAIQERDRIIVMLERAKEQEEVDIVA